VSNSPLQRAWRYLQRDLPSLGALGSKTSTLHVENRPAAPTTPPTRGYRDLTIAETVRFNILRWLGTVGALLIGLGGLGAGALPVVDNRYWSFPGGSIMGRLLQTSSMVTMVGVGFLVTAWLLAIPFVGVALTTADKIRPRASKSLVKRTFITWVAPIILTAPLFSQDVYSYLAQGSIAAQGLDPYSGGPADLLAVDNPLVRSVPYIWAHSGSPYGPVALGIAEAISRVTHDHIVAAVFVHRLVSIVAMVVTAWALTRLAKRCAVSAQATLWLAILNPLALLHLVGGVHNETIMLGCALAGLECGLRGIDHLKMGLRRNAVLWLVCGSALISCGGMVKVTGFIGLGFLGMAVARVLRARDVPQWLALSGAAVFEAVCLVASVALVTGVTGIGTGWISGQGGAATIRSWMSMTTNAAVGAGTLGMHLGLGDHIDSIAIFTRGVGMAVGAALTLRLLIATYLGRIHPLGGLGVSTLVLVVLFPVVHPWYVLWAVVPLAAWANRPVFRIPVIVYSALMSFFVLPRGLALQPGTVLSIYLGALLVYLSFMLCAWWLFRKILA
jgi:membrane protein